MSLINSHLKFHGILMDEPAFPGSSGKSTTQKYYGKVKGSVGAGMGKTKNATTDAPDQYGRQDGFAQGIMDARSENEDRKQSAI